MAKNHLLKMAVREDAIKAISKDNLPAPVVSILEELLHLPHLRDITRVRSKSQVIVDDSLLLGQPSHRKLTIKEEVSLRNLFRQDLKFKALRSSKSLSSPVNFYARFKLLTLGSIFTTTSYGCSPKRTNFCSLMRDGSIIFIESILVVKSNDLNSSAFIIGTKLGSISLKSYLPNPIDGTKFMLLPGQTTKFCGVSNVLFAYEPSDIMSKCVVAMQNSLTETYVVTALPNPFETD